MHNEMVFPQKKQFFLSEHYAKYLKNQR